MYCLLTIQKCLHRFWSHETSINMYSSAVCLIVCSQLWRKHSCLLQCVSDSFTSFCQKAVAPLLVIYRSTCMLLSLCELCCFVALGSCVVVVFDCWGGFGFFLFKISLHYSFSTVFQERCSSALFVFFFFFCLFTCLMLLSSHLFICTSFKFILPSLTYLSNVLLPFLESFLMYFTQRVSKFPKLRCKDIQNFGGNLV